ncbi:MAG: transposase [Nitrosotalea sp.]
MKRIFSSEKLVDGTIVATDSSLIYAANRRIWHKKDIMQNTMPRSGIDADARWGFTRTKGWMFGYKLHMSCSTGKLVVPLSAYFTTANISDNQMYCNLVEPLPGMVQYVVADMGYDDKKLYDYSRQHRITLVCPIRRYRHTKGERLQMIRFYQSRRGKKIYNKRNVSIESSFQCIKDILAYQSCQFEDLRMHNHTYCCVFWCIS